MTLFSRRNISAIAFVLAAATLVVDRIGAFAICGNDYSCAGAVADGVSIFMIMLPLAVLSALMYLLSDSVFNAWMRFVLWWVPLSMLAIFLWQDETGALFTVGKQTIAWLMSGLFLVISLGIIAYKAQSGSSK